ncbi:OLC1v1020502C1 [Oldenlandia corymbosa var. corymbosa]|uniref:OLC1v1020502C1 n=1 Tax=Oldenlandia corymbosa var. corymbosa TaxID=529605 RepID=A0AAV1EGL1_OLDCO|nr:OLC1v1020502C1 [Oldenlandia corymbosa var. corymbosa]
MEAKIDIISRELIKPSRPTPIDRRGFPLSLLDQSEPPAFIPILFLYQKQLPNSKIDLDPSKRTLHLKQSLSECLSEFYPLAGKLRPDDELSVDCDDSGVLFVEAEVNVSLAEAVNNAPFESFGQYLPFDPYINEGNDDEALLAIQITWFGCGGCAIGVCLFHRVADLISLITFMNSWASENRGDSTKSSMKLTPNFDLGRQLFPMPEFPIILPPVALKEGKKVCKRFIFNKEKLTELKELAISSPSSSSLMKNPTRVEVVTAFIWKQLIKLEQAKNRGTANKETTSRIWHVVNLRSRISSLVALPSDEFPFGNHIILGPASFTSSKNQDETDDDYGDLVPLTSNAIRTINEDYVLNRAVPLMRGLLNSSVTEQLNHQKTMASDWLFSSWCRFPIYEVDFGWGKPVSVGPVGTPGFNVVALKSTRNEEGIEAWISMLEAEFALLPDEFLSLAAADYFHA